jgi:hypothetical protein
LKEQSAIIQKVTEWKAKVDIAQIEQATEKIKAMFLSVDTAIKSTGDVMGNLAGAMSGVGSSQQLDLLRLLQDENDRRRDVFGLQKSLISAEIDNLNARTKLLNEGKDINIKISSENLKPHLEAFMFELLNAIQMRATAEGVQLLVGLGKQQ